tara:strand:- start:56 stop:853 length:798 start_codon:yes stop_codon:yes gene_type:complete
MMPVLIKLLMAIAIAFFLAAGMLFFIQERLIFHPERLPADHTFSFSVPFEEETLSNNGVSIHTIRFPKPESKGVILYFHGNAGSLDSWGHLYADFQAFPYDLWIMDYRGFGKSGGGIVREQELHSDAEKLYEAAKNQYPNGDVVIYGRSIGTGVAAKLAAEHPPKMLILETPYFNFVNLVDHIAPWVPSFLLRFQLMTNEYVTDQSFPIHLFHGDRDALIPAQSSDRLAELGENIKYHRIEGAGHNNIGDFPKYQRILQEIFAAP